MLNLTKNSATLRYSNVARIRLGTLPVRSFYLYRRSSDVRRNAAISSKHHLRSSWVGKRPSYWNELTLGVITSRSLNTNATETLDHDALLQLSNAEVIYTANPLISNIPNLDPRIAGDSASSSAPNDLPQFVPPPSCPGCGADSQVDKPAMPGYYDPKRMSMKRRNERKGQQAYAAKKRREDEIFERALASMEPEELQQAEEPIRVRKPKGSQKMEFGTGLAEDSIADEVDDSIKLQEAVKAEELRQRLEFFTEYNASKPPLCARCHSLVHHHSAAPIPAFTYAAITQPIANCKYSRIHIYHIIDAADFPMSLLPNLRRNILKHLPSRKSRGHIDFSFIVTRADLLMPKEEMVTRLMTYLRTVLKEALNGEEMGDIRVVSAKRTWTTKKIQDDIRSQKGGVFLIGKTNVGKSRLFESIFPRKSFHAQGSFGRGDGVERGGLKWFEDGATRVNVPFQVIEMPTVSDIPGTTAGPVRAEIGDGHGELVDLPGMERGKLFNFVRDECVKDMIMTERILPEQYTIKTGQSLLLAGVIRITPVTEDQIFLAYPFLTLPAHLTNTLKAIELISHPHPEDCSIPLLFGKAGIASSIASAGKLTLEWEVTQRRNPKLEHLNQEEMEMIPYRVYSIDVLIEGCGWVEVVAQTRRGQPPPIIEVFSPLGGGIGSRVPMGAEILGRRPVAKVRPGSRPRRSMKGVKKVMKATRRAEKST